MRVTAGPTDPWPRVAASLSPGDELALLPGDYPGGWAIMRGGTGGAPVVICALDDRRLPRIWPPTRGSAVVDVCADHVTLRGLAFGPTPASVHGVTLSGASGVTIEHCRFESMGGLAIVETMTASRIVVRGNQIRRSRTTALYFGCHEGQCAITELLIEGNRIEGVTAPRGQTGYGIQVKLNSFATIRDNIVADTKGPPIMVYGADDGATPSVVEGNRVTGSRRSSGIVIGGGPAIVRNNVATWNAEGGIALEDYGRRGLLRAIEVGHNTVHGNRRGGILVPRKRPIEASIVGNAAHAVRGTPALPGERHGLVLRDNLACTDCPCLLPR